MSVKTYDRINFTQSKMYVLHPEKILYARLYMLFDQSLKQNTTEDYIFYLYRI